MSVPVGSSGQNNHQMINDLSKSNSVSTNKPVEVKSSTGNKGISGNEKPDQKKYEISVPLRLLEPKMHSVFEHTIAIENNAAKGQAADTTIVNAIVKEINKGKKAPVISNELKQLASLGLKNLNNLDIDFFFDDKALKNTDNPVLKDLDKAIKDNTQKQAALFIINEQLLPQKASSDNRGSETETLPIDISSQDIKELQAKPELVKEVLNLLPEALRGSFNKNIASLNQIPSGTVNNQTSSEKIPEKVKGSKEDIAKVNELAVDAIVDSYRLDVIKLLIMAGLEAQKSGHNKSSSVPSMPKHAPVA